MNPTDSVAIVDTPLLDTLLNSSGLIPTHTLAGRLGISVDAAVHEIERLRASGCVIESHPQHGVGLCTSGLACWADYLQWRLGLERRVEVYQSTGSTQDAAKRLAESVGAPSHRAIVVSEEQTSGRGRLGRRWVAPPETAVTFSYVLWARSDEAVYLPDRLTLASAVALACAVETATGLPNRSVQIKWPNDLLLNGKKLAGILVERFTISQGGGCAIVIGVGINVRQTSKQIPEELRDRVTSLTTAGVQVDRLKVLAEAITHLDRAYAENDAETMVTQWRARCPMLAQQVTLESDGKRVRGKVIDIDPQQGLIVMSDSGSLVHMPAATTTVL